MEMELTVESMDKWNEQNPDDCHSPWMGIMDDELEQPVQEAAPVVEVVMEDVPKSPKTGDYSNVITTAMFIVIAVAVLAVKKAFSKGE
jgi:hypothetical protein